MHRESSRPGGPGEIAYATAGYRGTARRVIFATGFDSHPIGGRTVAPCQSSTPAISTAYPKPRSSLHQRATEAARPDGIIDDPMAIALQDRLDYDYQDFGRTHRTTALRALVFDAVTRDYLAGHPRATVVALAEGLQTSF